MSMLRQLSLVKGARTYVFRYRAGHEADVITAFAGLATEQGNDFDWFDAAVLSYQMGRRMEDELDHVSAAADGT